MENLEKCEKCGVTKSSSKYARLKMEGGDSAKNILACRNYPVCSEAEKEIQNIGFELRE